MNNSKHYVIASVIVALAFVLQPFTMMLAQNYLAPIMANTFLGDNAGGGNTEEVDPTGKTITLGTKDHVKNGETASVFLIEYSDLECPFCKQYHPAIKNVVDKSAGKVAFVYKHFPLQFHPNAEPSAIAAECIAKITGENNFWNFIDGVFTGKVSLNEKSYLVEAGKAGATAQAFNACIAGDEAKAKVTTDTQEGAGLGVQGTPHTIVAKKNSKGELEIVDVISGAMGQDVVQAAVDEAMK